MTPDILAALLYELVMAVATDLEPVELFSSKRVRPTIRLSSSPWSSLLAWLKSRLQVSKVWNLLFTSSELSKETLQICNLRRRSSPREHYDTIVLQGVQPDRTNAATDIVWQVW